MEIKTLQVLFVIQLVILGLQSLIYFGVEILEGKPHDVRRNIDRSIPFVPEWVFIYNLWFPLITVFPLVLYAADASLYLKYQSAVFCDIVFSALCYVLYPTSFVRPRTPETVAGRVMKLVYKGSFRGLNCAPSMHCSLCYLILALSLTCTGMAIGLRVILVAVALLIVCSTLFTKQHVVVDAVTAIPVAAVSLLFGWHFPAGFLTQWLL